MEPVVHKHPTVEAMYQETAALLAQTARSAVQQRGACWLGLSGGRTPQGILSALKAPPLAEAMPWPQLHFFWVDERLVAYQHPASNFGMARQILFADGPAARSHLHPMPVAGRPEDNVRQYEDEIRALSPHGACPSFDLLLLGIGPDGHTASLFPGAAALAESQALVLAVDGRQGRPPVPRLTMTLPLINAARQVLFAATGADKRAAIQQVLAKTEPRLPAACVQPLEGCGWILGPGAW